MSSISDTLYNALTGNLTQSQVDALQQQETASLVAAGADPSSAASQAQTDVNTTLSSFTGSGGLGLSWTGATPSGSSFLSAAGNSIQSALLNIPWYWWLAGIGTILTLVFVSSYAKSR